jgi:hypothetical protein
MPRIYDPAQLSHPRLREFAVVAAMIATLAEAANDLEDLLVDVPPEERVLPDYSTPWPWEFDSFVVALAVAIHSDSSLVQEPKFPAARRAVKRLPETMTALRAQKAMQNAQRLAYGASWLDRDLIFATGDGKLLNPNNL